MKVNHRDDTLLVDISDALSERDRVRFTVHTVTTLPQFSKQVLSVVRQHEEFIWLHDCLADNDQYAGHIIPPPPPKPDFDASREKLQRLGDSEAQLTKDEFSKMKQELEAEYLAIFKKTVAMHEMFLQRLAAHEKFREDSNFKIFLEYENELAVRGKSKREKLAGSIQNIGRSLTDFVITTSQVANTHSLGLGGGVGTSSSGGSSGSSSSNSTSSGANNNNVNNSASVTHVNNSTDNNGNVFNNNTNSNKRSNHPESTSENANVISGNKNKISSSSSSSSNQTTLLDTNNGTPDKLDHDKQHSNVSFSQPTPSNPSSTSSTNTYINANNQLNSNYTNRNNTDNTNYDNDVVDEQYFEKERLFLALYYNSIKEAATQADRVTQAHKRVADNYLHIAQQLVKLAGIEVLPITSTTKDPSRFLSCPLPSLALPSIGDDATSTQNVSSSLLELATKSQSSASRSRDLMVDRKPCHAGSGSGPLASSSMSQTSGEKHLELVIDNRELGEDDDSSLSAQIVAQDTGNTLIGDNLHNRHVKGGDVTRRNDKFFGYQSMSLNDLVASIDQTSEGLKRLLLNVSDHFEQARKVEARIASDEDLKLTDILLYYERDTVAAQALLMRRLRFRNEYETATKNVEKARVKGSRTALQYAEVIQKQAKENFLSISKLAKQELIEYKKRRVDSFRRSFTDLAELELKHLRSNSQLIINCLNICRGLAPPPTQPVGPMTTKTTQLQQSQKESTSTDVSINHPSTSTGARAGEGGAPAANRTAMIEVPLEKDEGAGLDPISRDGSASQMTTSPPPVQKATSVLSASSQLLTCDAELKTSSETTTRQQQRQQQPISSTETVLPPIPSSETPLPKSSASPSSSSS